MRITLSTCELPEQERKLERETAETAHLVHQHTHAHAHDSEEPRGGFDMEEDEDYREASDDDSDDDARSMSTVVPHELERVEEEDEDQMAEEERMGREDKLSENEKHEDDLLESEEEERERRREDLGLGRPRTPEPTRMGLDYPSLLSSAPRRSMTSPLAQLSSSEDVYDQVQKLSKQVSTVMALTTTLEAQHLAAQTTIQSLENKVEALEGMLKAAEEALKAKTVQEEEAKEIARREVQVTEEEQKVEKASLTDMLAEWKKSVEGQWSHVQEEWKEERERLNKAREEWESKMGATLAVAAANGFNVNESSTSLLVGNGDVFKHNGLVTPPSPRSQSSNSPRYRRRRRRPSSRSPTGERGRSTSPLSDDDDDDEADPDPDPDTDTTLATSDVASSPSSPRAYSPELIRDMEILKEKLSDGTMTIAAIAAAAGLTAAAVSTTGINTQAHKAARTLATPEPSVYKLSSSVDDPNPDPVVSTAAADDASDLEQSSWTSHLKNSVASANLESLFLHLVLMLVPNLQSQEEHQHPGTASTTTTSAIPTLNFRTAVGVLVLGLATAAVVWKVKTE